MGLREENKREKRMKILAIAERLIREKGDTSFNMRALAKQAEVSFSTPFNLFENKGDILNALFHARVRLNWQEYGIGVQKKGHINHLFNIAQQSAAAYVEDPILFRPLIVSLGVIAGDTQRRNTEQASLMWRHAVIAAIEAGDINRNRKPGPLSRSLHAMFRGALWRWALGEICDEEFQIQVQYGTASWLLSVCTQQSRPKIERKRNQFEKALSDIQKNIS